MKKSTEKPQADTTEQVEKPSTIYHVSPQESQPKKAKIDEKNIVYHVSK